MPALPVQPALLLPPPAFGRALQFRLALEADPGPMLARLRLGWNLEWGVVGLGEPLTRALGAAVPGLRAFPALAGSGCAVASTQQALWAFVRGASRTETFDRADRVRALLEGPFELAGSLDTFTYRDGRDLTGYVDGTANPSDTDSPGVALVADGAGLAGSSFVAVQRWVHDLRQFRSHGQRERDLMVGRRQDNNEEIADAPAWAHVKRTDQIAAYLPPVFIVRRSMPWAEGADQGLEFIAYGKTLDFFERHLRRMVGLDDGIVDAVFRFSRAVQGSYYWCPPVAAGQLDLSQVRVG
jgi:putative iron-dependent peroxidase